MDSLKHCANQQHYLKYPWAVEYKYNSRGFRDSEWPDDLESAVWCVGDSFTVGLGCPVEHTWPYLLQNTTGRRTINVSMDGASNLWIARVAEDILSAIPNATVIVHWSYMHRREMSITEATELKFKKFYKDVRDISWPDASNIDQLPQHIQQELVAHGWSGVYAEDRLVHWSADTDQQDLKTTHECINKLGDRVIHSAIPEWMPLQCSFNFPGLVAVPRLDRSRDGHHYDKITAEWFVQQLIPILKHRAI